MDEHEELQARLRRLGTAPIEPRRQVADLLAMADVATSPRSRSGGFLGSKVRVAAAFLAGLLLGSTGLAAADALPDPAQHIAHNVLARVGVDVPNPERYHGPECGAEVQKNHGGYVRDDHALATSECGKPIRGGGSNSKGNGSAKGPCQGPPPWAGNKDLTDAEVEAAKTERAALCGSDADDAEETDELEAESSDPTTTTEPPTTTTDTTTTTAAIDPSTTTTVAP
jgi:hypothetical protein